MPGRPFFPFHHEPYGQPASTALKFDSLGGNLPYFSLVSWRLGY
jgi:hypothetical protein